MLGTRGPFTRAALEVLLESGVGIAGLALPRALPAGPPSRRLTQRRSLLDPGDAPALASGAGIRCWEIGRPGEEAGCPAPFEESGADLVCVACFPWRLPAAWFERPRRGAVNLHPSLLPAWRGPAPLFWQLRAGAATGVTLHRIDAGLDTGPVVARQPVSLPDGIRTAAAEARLASSGARLLAAALRSGRLAGETQDESAATRQGWPGAADRRVPTSWPARRAFNFIRGAERWGPFVIGAGADSVPVSEALGYQLDLPEARPGERPLRFADGWLRVTHG